MPDLLDLKIFARVIESGSLSAAGRELQLSPTVVSKRLTRLEEQLGARLIQRTTRQLTLTEIGEGYHERVLAVLAAMEEADNYVSGSGEPRGVLRVSAPTGFGRRHIAPRLLPFLRTYPDVKLELDLSDTYVDLIAGGFDVVVRIGALNDSSMVARRLAPNHRVLCATPEYLAEMGEPETIADLDSHRLVTTTPQSDWHLEGPDGPITYRPNSLLNTNSSEVVSEAVLGGLGIGMRSTWDVADDLRSGRVKRVMPDFIGSSRVGIWAIYPSRRLVPPKVRAFIDHLADMFGPEPYWEHDLIL
jgi:DNA-binding transcriptional LysR family regulator